jgi:filamentous hemagglutinin family protein
MQFFKIFCFLQLVICLHLTALPQNPSVVIGTAEFIQTPSSLQIQVSDHAVIDWASFSIALNETVQIIHSSPHSSLLNRISGDLPTHIEGFLQSNGEMYFINPQGLLIGTEALIKAASFIASTYPLSNEDFLLKQAGLLFKGDSIAPIIHEGTIRAQDGIVALFAHRIGQEGTIFAANTASLAAAHEILLVPSGDTIMHLRPQLKGGGIKQSGQIEAIKILIQSEGTYSLGILQSGSLQSPDPTQKESCILLKAPNNPLEIKGRLSASTIRLEAERIDILSDSSLSAPEGTIHIATEGGPLFQNGSISAHEITLLLQKSTEQPLFQSGILKTDFGGSIHLNTPLCIQEGILSAPGGFISILASKAYTDLPSSLLSVNHPNANAGSITLFSDTLVSSGTHQAIGNSEGGQIHLSGKNVSLLGATIDASGQTKGGEILIGGDLRGKNPAIPNADRTFLNPSTLITANCQNGPAGRIIIWSTEKTEQLGTIQATGPQKGFINISSAEKVIFKN